MNTAGANRYSKDWEKLSKKLRMIYHCATCGEKDYLKKECHHIDFDKHNNSKENIIVLCKECHKLAHNNLLTIPKDFKGYGISGFSVKVACDTSSTEDWFDSKKPLKLLPFLPPPIANKFRKEHIKNFVNIGSSNLYIGIEQYNLFGVLAFKNDDYIDYDIMLIADTTISSYKKSIDLLLYVLKTKQIKDILEQKFNREVKTAYSMVFSQHNQINRYRKHGKLVKKIKVDGGYNLGYIFDLGTIPTLKAAKSMFMQKHKEL